MSDLNQVFVVLSIEANSPIAPLYQKYCACAVLPPSEAQKQFLFLRCSDAVTEGSLLSVTIQQNPPKGKYHVRIPASIVLLVTDAPLSDKKGVGFLA